MPIADQDPILTLIANYSSIQAAVQSQGREIGEIRQTIEKMPSRMAPIMENAVLKGLKQQQIECPAMKALPGLLQAVGELKGRTDEITGTFAIPDEITKRIRNAPSRASIVPDFVKSSTFKWIISAVVAAILSAFGIKVASDTENTTAAADRSDTDAPAVTVTHR